MNEKKSDENPGASARGLRHELGSLKTDVFKLSSVARYRENQKLFPLLFTSDTFPSLISTIAIGTSTEVFFTVGFAGVVAAESECEEKKEKNTKILRIDNVRLLIDK
jgi:hypothetical protein